MKPTIEILEEAREELCGILDHISCMFGLEDELYVDLEKVEAKLSLISKRLTNPVVQQEPSKHIPKDPYKKTSDFAEVKAFVDAGKLPPLGSVKTGIQYLNSKKGN